MSRSTNYELRSTKEEGTEASGSWAAPVTSHQARVPWHQSPVTLLPPLHALRTTLHASGERPSSHLAPLPADRLYESRLLPPRPLQLGLLFPLPASRVTLHEPFCLLTTDYRLLWPTAPTTYVRFSSSSRRAQRATGRCMERASSWYRASIPTVLGPSTCRTRGLHRAYSARATGGLTLSGGPKCGLGNDEKFKVRKKKIRPGRHKGTKNHASLLLLGLWTF